MSRIGKSVAALLPIKSERGAAAVEYGLLVALIAVAIITAVALVGTNLTEIFNTVAEKLTPPS
jgi:pilus assembly protein Flp/PilA